MGRLCTQRGTDDCLGVSTTQQSAEHSTARAAAALHVQAGQQRQDCKWRVHAQAVRPALMRLDADLEQRCRYDLAAQKQPGMAARRQGRQPLTNPPRAVTQSHSSSNTYSGQERAGATMPAQIHSMLVDGADAPSFVWLRMYTPTRTQHRPVPTQSQAQNTTYMFVCCIYTRSTSSIKPIPAQAQNTPQNQPATCNNTPP